MFISIVIYFDHLCRSNSCMYILIIIFVLLLTGIHKVVSAVLLFGNMSFKQERNSDQAILTDNTGACLTFS